MKFKTLLWCLLSTVALSMSAQNNVAEERPHQILASSRIQKGHLEYYDIYFFDTRQELPLLDDVLVVAAKPVDTLDVDQVAGLELLDHLQVHGSVEVLAGNLVSLL